MFEPTVFNSKGERHFARRMLAYWLFLTSLPDLGRRQLIQHERGVTQTLEQTAEALLRHRFGPDERIPAIARRLAPLGPDAYIARIHDADGLDERLS